MAKRSSNNSSSKAKTSTKKPASKTKAKAKAPARSTTKTARSSHAAVSRKAPAGNILQRKAAMFSHLDGYGQLIGICFAVASVLGAVVIIMALIGFVIFSARSLSDGAGIPGITYALFLGTALYLCVSIAITHLLGRVAVRSEGTKSYVAGTLAIAISLIQSYVLIRLLLGI